MNNTPTPASPLMERSRIASAMFYALYLMDAGASPMDDESQPSPTDPSYYRPQPADPAAALLEIRGMPEANHGSLSLPNGGQGDRNTPRTDNVLPPALQTSFNFPTNGKPSPLFGAEPFT